jgi:hypothetical protein
MKRTRTTTERGGPATHAICGFLGTWGVMPHSTMFKVGACLL